MPWVVHAPDVSFMHALMAWRQAVGVRGSVAPARGRKWPCQPVVIFIRGRAAFAPLGASLALDLLCGLDQTLGTRLFAATVALLVLALLVFSADVEFLICVAIL